MRQICSTVLVGLTLGLSAPEAPAQTDTIVRVSAGGSVTIRLAPTRAIVYLLIEATAQTSGEAVGRGSESSTSVLDTLRKAGGAEEIQLVQYGVVPTPPNYGGGNGGPPNTFTSRSAIRFVTALSSVQSLTSAAYARGASASAPPVFQHDGLDAAVTRAIEEATVMARERAEAMARGMGGRLGAMTHLSTQPMYGGADYSAAQGFTLPQYDQQSRPLPEIRQTIQVNATWKFVPR
jgi:uncharacterized protein YggE